jgi:hypothetical protein
MAQHNMTHYEWTAVHKPCQPCYSYHMTFGGHCLNCGYRPPDGYQPPSTAKKAQKGKDNASS